MSERQKENIANLKKLRNVIKKDIKTVASVNKVQKALDKLNPSEKKLFNKEFPGEMQKFKDMRKNVLAREEPRYRAGPSTREEPRYWAGPSTRKSMPLPKSKPKKKPLPKTLPKSKPKKKNGVTFDTTGTLPGKTIRRKK
tara:strand:- start:152 stop:571 length:420 start_codon:yes stop_codon:yes gene_type:complete